MIENHRLLSLNKKLGFTPPQLMVLWGDLLQHDEPIRQSTAVNWLDVLVLATGHWLLEHAKLELGAAAALLRRMLPAFGDMIAFSELEHGTSPIEQGFVLNIYDYQFVNWTGSPSRAYNLRELRFGDELRTDEVTLLRLNLSPLLALLLKNEGANDSGQAPAVAQPTGA